MRDDFDPVVADRFKVLDDVPVPDTWSRVQFALLDPAPVVRIEADLTTLDDEPNRMRTAESRHRWMLAAAAVLLVVVAAVVVVERRSHKSAVVTTITPPTVVTTITPPATTIADARRRRRDRTVGWQSPTAIQTATSTSSGKDRLRVVSQDPTVMP